MISSRTRHALLIWLIEKLKGFVLKARRDSGTSEDEKAEDLAMSKELVNILIKEVYNKLMKSGVAVPQARNSVENKPVQVRRECYR